MKFANQLFFSRRRPLSKIFSEIYDRDLWNGGSGPGSTPEATEPYRDLVQEWFSSNDVAKVLDLGCGDWQFSKLLDLSSVDYLGVDVAPEVIIENQTNFEAVNIRFKHISSIEEIKGEFFDLVVCKDVLQHLSNKNIHKILKFIRNNSRFAIITNDLASEGRGLVKDIQDGEYRALNLLDEPFDWQATEVLRWNANGFIKSSLLSKHVNDEI